MSLEWDTRKIGADIDPAVTRALVMHALNVGIRAITEENAATFYERVRTYEVINGALLGTISEPRPITPEDIRSHIGLMTSARNLSDDQWRQLVNDWFEIDARERWNR